MTHENEHNTALLPRMVEACIPLLRAEGMAQDGDCSWDDVRVLFQTYDSLLMEFVRGEEHRRYEVDSVVRKRSSEI